MKLVTLLAVLAAATTTGALAQQAAHGAAPDLPAICLAAATSGGHDMAVMPPATGVDEAHSALMAGMDRMNTDMMAAASAADIDVAFVCGMIPHHRGAIDMARAELQYGDDPWARTLAEGVIAAQEKEVAEMLDWLAKQP